MVPLPQKNTKDLNGQQFPCFLIVRTFHIDSVFVSFCFGAMIGLDMPWEDLVPVPGFIPGYSGRMPQKGLFTEVFATCNMCSRNLD